MNNNIPYRVAQVIGASGEAEGLPLGRREPGAAAVVPAVPSDAVTDEQIIRTAYRHLSTWNEDHITFARAVLALSQTTQPQAEAVPSDVNMWAVHIQGPDDVYAAPDREIADAVALVLNRQFLRRPFPSEVKVQARVVRWPHGYEAWSAQKDLLQLEVKGIES